MTKAFFETGFDQDFSMFFPYIIHRHLDKPTAYIAIARFSIGQPKTLLSMCTSQFFLQI